MTTIPVSWLISIVSGLIVVLLLGQPRLPIAARLFFSAALIGIALVAVIVGLRTEYSAPVLAASQPYIALLPAPALWLGFQSLTRQDGKPAPRQLIGHAVFVILAECAVAMPIAWSVDIVVTLVNLVYVALLTRDLRRGADAYVQVPPESFRTVRIALLGSIGFFALILIADISILIAALVAGQAGAMRFLTGFSAGLTAAVLVGVFVTAALLVKQRPRAESTPDPSADAEDQALLEQLSTLLLQGQLYKDPDLTLARLGRRLGRPARSVSVAVNRVTGDNISRYINGFRIRHAVDLLKTTELPVTEVMLESGFVSKSSFNSEFRRITGQTPSECRKAARL